jgi:hypothetical protein
VILEVIKNAFQDRGFDDDGRLWRKGSACTKVQHPTIKLPKKKSSGRRIDTDFFIDI